MGEGVGSGVGGGDGVFVGSAVTSLHVSGLHTSHGPLENCSDTVLHASSLLPPLIDST